MPNIRDERVSRDALSERNRDRGGASSYLHYYSDQGFTSTPEYNKAYKANESDYNASVAKSNELIASKQNEVNQAKIGVDQSKSQIDQSQNQLNSSLIPVNVYNDKQLVATYKLPMEAIQKIKTDDGSMVLWTPDAVQQNPWQTPRRTQTELAAFYAAQVAPNTPTQSLQIGVNNTRLPYYTQAFNEAQSNVDLQMAQAETQLAQANSVLNNYYSQINNVQGQISQVTAQNAATQAERDKQHAAFIDEYKNRLKQMGDVYGSFNVQPK